MLLTLDELRRNIDRELSFTLDFKKDIENMPSILDIETCFVEGTFSFSYSRYVRFNLDVKVDLIVAEARTLEPIRYPLEFTIEDDISDTSDVEFKLKEDSVDLRELVWGWLVAEMPYTVYKD